MSLTTHLCRLLLLLTPLSLAGCMSLQVTAFNLPVPHDGYRLERDIAYGDLPEQSFDLYRPDAPSRPARLVIFLHGGSWTTGDKAQYRFLGQALSSQGAAVAIANFRQFPAIRFPVFLDDAARAVSFIAAHATEFGCDPQNIVLMGHSSGAHIAAMLALDRHYLAAYGYDPARLRGVIGMAGPYDFLPLTDPEVARIFAPASDDLALTQPIHFVSAGAPPFLLLHGRDDQVVGVKNSDHLAEALRRAGVAVEEKVYPDMGHLGIIVDLQVWFRDRAPVLQDIAAFVANPAKPVGTALAGQSDQ